MSSLQTRRPTDWRTDSRAELHGGRSELSQPTLLDRLAAPAGEAASTAARPLNAAQLRAAVLRDLSWLLNTASRGAELPLDGYEHVRRSVLNFGIVPISGKRLSDVECADLEASVREAIVRFEPRVERDSVEVRCVPDAHLLNTQNALTLEIRGRVWSIPYPVDFLLRSRLDLETGHVGIESLSGL